MTVTTVAFSAQAEAQSAAATLAAGNLVVVDKKSEMVEEPPPAPYDTVTFPQKRAADSAALETGTSIDCSTQPYDEF